MRQFSALMADARLPLRPCISRHQGKGKIEQTKTNGQTHVGDKFAANKSRDLVNHYGAGMGTSNVRCGEIYEFMGSHKACIAIAGELGWQYVDASAGLIVSNETR